MKVFFIFFLISISSLYSFGQVNSFDIDSSKLNKPLSSQLDSTYKVDQSTRYAYFAAKQHNEPASIVDNLLKEIRKTDQENLIKVNSIIERFGWLGPQKIGIDGAQGLFLVIQHADLKTQEYYLPIIRTAEKKGEILSSNLAILEDRVCMRSGKEQIYGSQGFTDSQTGKKYIYPIIDVDNLDKRRKSMGMPPMRDYIKSWNLEEYKKNLPNIKLIVKSQSIK